MERTRRYWILRIVMFAALSLVLASCGFGDDDPDPTATSAAPEAQPTVATTDEEAETTADTSTDPEGTPGTAPVNIDMSSPDAVGTPAATTETDTATDTETATDTDASTSTDTETETVADVDTATETETEVSTDGDVALAGSTPEPPTGDATTDADATPPAAQQDQVDETTATNGYGTPAASGIADTPATPEAADTDVGDGTTGALSIDGTPVAAPTDAATPAAGGTPVPGGTPVASEIAREVTGCEVSEVPPFTGETTSYALTVDVNFRTGPGTDCDQIGDGPLGEFTAVEIIGGPVVRTDLDDDFEWVQVQVGDTTGWLVLEFLEPAE